MVDNQEQWLIRARSQVLWELLEQGREKAGFVRMQHPFLQEEVFFRYCLPARKSVPR